MSIRFELEGSNVSTALREKRIDRSALKGEGGVGWGGGIGSRNLGLSVHIARTVVELVDQQPSKRRTLLQVPAESILYSFSISAA